MGGYQIMARLNPVRTKTTVLYTLIQKHVEPHRTPRNTIFHLFEWEFVIKKFSV
jgi:hypothetical protein